MSALFQKWNSRLPTDSDQITPVFNDVCCVLDIVSLVWSFVQYNHSSVVTENHTFWIYFLLLGRVAVGAQRPIVIKLSRERSVGRSVGLSVCPVHCGKTADRIRMPFGIIGRTDPGMRQVVGLGIGPREGVPFGARHCNQWGLYGVCVRQRRDAALFSNYFGQTCWISVRYK